MVPVTEPAIIHPDVGPLKLGRTAPHPGARRMLFGSFVRAVDVGPLPVETSYSPVAQPCLDQMLLNDTLSCCTTATAMHIAGLILGNTGTPIKFSNAQVEAFYSISTGYVPGKPATDQGGDEITVLNVWRQQGLEKGLHGVAGHVSVDGSDETLVKTALAKLGNLYFGVCLPDSWLSARNGITLNALDPPNPQNGHAFCGVNYDAVGVWCVLWGGIKVRLTWAAVSRYTKLSAGGELHCVVSRDAIVKGTQRAYNGISYAEMSEAFNALGGNI